MAISPGGTQVTMEATVGLTTWPINTATSGTNASDVANTCFYASLWVPGETLVTGVSFLVGGTGGTDLVFASIFDVSGNLLANSATAGTTVGTTAQLQNLPLVTPLNLPGPMVVLIGLTFNGGSATFRAVPAYCGGSMIAGSVAQTFATGPASITPSATKFTADKAPVALLY
jgi:hypothetical protein